MKVIASKFLNLFVALTLVLTSVVISSAAAADNFDAQIDFDGNVEPTSCARAEFGTYKDGDLIPEELLAEVYDSVEATATVSLSSVSGFQAVYSNNQIILFDVEGLTAPYDWKKAKFAYVFNIVLHEGYEFDKLLVNGEKYVEGQSAPLEMLDLASPAPSLKSSKDSDDVFGEISGSSLKITINKISVTTKVATAGDKVSATGPVPTDDALDPVLWGFGFIISFAVLGMVRSTKHESK